MRKSRSPRHLYSPRRPEIVVLVQYPEIGSVQYPEVLVLVGNLLSILQSSVELAQRQSDASSILRIQQRKKLGLNWFESQLYLKS
jgi:hypothetical protein